MRPTDSTAVKRPAAAEPTLSCEPAAVATKQTTPHADHALSFSNRAEANPLSLSRHDSKLSSDVTNGGDIKAKLASDFGCRVSEPKPAKSATAQRSIGASQYSEDPPPEFRGRGHFQGRGRGGFRCEPGNKALRSQRWPNKNDIPKPVPKRWETNWNSERSVVDSLQADSGWGEDKKKRAADYGGSKLTDWTGGWAPAPIDWDARPGFSDSGTLARIEKWLDAVENDLHGLQSGIEEALVLDGKNAANDLAPRYWVPVVIGNQAPNVFFADLLASVEPRPLDDDDLTGARPWWVLYGAPSDCVLLSPCSHPEISGFDPNEENLREKAAREADQGSDNHAENRKRAERAEREAKQKKAQEKLQREKNRASKLSKLPSNSAAHQRIKPGVNIYLRMAKASDMAQVRDIYNYYVDFTCCTPETETRTTADMQMRYDRVMSNTLPFLVACERGGKLPRRGGRRHRGGGEDIWLPDRIVGFATADDFHDMMGMYRFTCEIEVYVAKDRTMQGIAKCLCDKMLAMLDPDYLERGGYDIQGDDLEGVGPSRVMQNIIVHVPYEKPERLEWMSRWLYSMDFEQEGNLSDVGNKVGMSISLAMFRRKTGAVFDAANPPTMMRYPL
ncbi:hypothetical protein BAUCODRAFT_38316 [Baudoinia panamericana UAMH 10762]|uniref:N-acetyltransferase domain-containing protein n=1 Tax=Baudoinia panamericana (strain UAMH 10762) TaxID=717646 RepID=M2M7I6_BAUPA|nr:uncharacterized protein BAUCODRAFT_38316 [Baudoinia panamericana UAMH 10762]EMC92286.1 hypothetical protein BAUCODRAFT_38316 [Baudoinia panamericana UAMH 10762]